MRFMGFHEQAMAAAEERRYQAFCEMAKTNPQMSYGEYIDFLKRQKDQEEKDWEWKQWGKTALRAEYV